MAVRQKERRQPVRVTGLKRGLEVFRRYYEYAPKGPFTAEYTVRLNQAGRFELPPTRVEAMYAPERMGERPNEAIEVAP